MFQSPLCELQITLINLSLVDNFYAENMATSTKAAKKVLKEYSETEMIEKY